MTHLERLSPAPADTAPTPSVGERRLSILFASDGTRSSQVALDHLARVFEGTPPAARPQVRLLHVVRIPLGTAVDFVGEPGFATETIGAISALPDEDPARTEALAAHVRAGEGRLVAQMRALQDLGWPPDRLSAEVVEIEDAGLTGSSVAQAIADAARAHRVDVVLVGRERHGRIQEMLLKSTGERILHDVREVAVWVAGGPSAEAVAEHEHRAEPPLRSGPGLTSAPPAKSPTMSAGAHEHDDPRR